MGTKLGRIRELAAKNPSMVFTSIYHLIDKELLRQRHFLMDGEKATGVDKTTKAEYEANLDANLDDLVERLKTKTYKPQPSLRVYIPKANGKMRPIGIAAYEDKLVQDALNCVLSAVFEGKLRDSMHGFMPKRSCHTALRALNKLIEGGRTSWIVEADIKGYFNNMEHRIILDLVKHRIADPNILWLINKFLKAGVMADGKWHATEKGTEQGNLASPILANIYMNYMLALWFEKVFRSKCRGDCGIVIYADDFVATFQYKDDAELFLIEVGKRFAQFGLELEPEKTRLVEFGRSPPKTARGAEKASRKPSTSLGSRTTAPPAGMANGSESRGKRLARRCSCVWWN